MATPELTFARMGQFASDIQLVEIGIDLCAKYYIDANGEIQKRRGYLTTPKKLEAFLHSSPDMRGFGKALAALKWVLPNSGSPRETKTKIQFCHPLRFGGFGLPFNAFNYDFRAGRLARITDQDEYSIDLADTRSKTGLEYDGKLYHEDRERDERRRNELAALGWTIFPIRKNVLNDPEATIRAAEQVARKMGKRIRRPACWESKFVQLRKDLGLPV